MIIDVMSVSDLRKDIYFLWDLGLDIIRLFDGFIVINNFDNFYNKVVILVKVFCLYLFLI